MNEKVTEKVIMSFAIENANLRLEIATLQLRIEELKNKEQQEVI